jgi:Glycosyltransferase family 87
MAAFAAPNLVNNLAVPLHAEQPQQLRLANGGLSKMTMPQNKQLILLCAALLIADSLMLAISKQDIGFILFDWMFSFPSFFNDWRNLYLLASQLPDPNATHLYSPPVTWFMSLASKQMSYGVSIFLFAVPVALLALALWRLSGDVFVALLVVCSYPFLFSIARGNMELHVFLLVFVGLLARAQNRNRLFFLLIFLASLVKPFALVFLLVAARRSWLRIIGIAIASAIADLFLLYSLNNLGLEAIQRYFSAAQTYERLMVFGPGGDLYNNSFYILFGKLILDVRNPLALPMAELISCALVGLTTLYSAWLLGVFDRTGDNISNALEYITFIMLPILLIWCIPVSADYRLCYFLLSAYFVISNGNQYFDGRTKVVLLWWYFLIITPKHFIYFGSELSGALRYDSLRPDLNYTLQSIVNPVLMFLLCPILMYGLYRSRLLKYQNAAFADQSQL